MLNEKVQEIQQRALESFKGASSSQALYDLKVKYLGKTGEFSVLMREMGSLPKEERPQFGKMVNEVKRKLESVYSKKADELKKQELDQRLAREALDMSLPGPNIDVGSHHLVSRTINEIVNIMTRLGYSVRTGPLIEKDRYNFEALNLPADHPARDMQDTFYISDNEVLRTHTSPIQIHAMESEKPPLKILAPGSVFRVDSDSSHSPNFHQIECLCVDRQISMADLKGTISYFVKELFGQDIQTRFRPSFFPFTEPSAEVDCMCPICRGSGCRMCSQTGWVEIGGSGLVNPKVFEHVGLSYPEWQGFAFGFGIERMAIIKYRVDHIRHFTENDTRFLEQFKL